MDEQWDEMLERLKKFKIRNTRFPFEYSDNYEERKLGVWCMKQLKSKVNLSEERIAKLEEINNWWWWWKDESWNTVMGLWCLSQHW